MSIFEIRGGRITHQYLMRKTKSELAYEVLDLLTRLDAATTEIKSLKTTLGIRIPAIRVDAVGKVVKRPEFSNSHTRPVTPYMGPGDD